MQALGAEPSTCMQLPTNAALEHLASKLLEPCPKEDADKATVIRRQLKADLGRWQAEAVLSCYVEACLRHQGKCSRYFVDEAGATLRLIAPANAAEAP